MSVTELTTSLLEQPSHDGSELYVLDHPEEVGREATVRVRVPLDVDGVVLRYMGDGEGRGVRDGGGGLRRRHPDTDR